MMNRSKQIFNIVHQFKHRCKTKGWGVLEPEEVIQRDNQMINILWTRAIHPATFNRIARDETYTVRDGRGYHPIHVSYNAWISATPISNAFKRTLRKHPQLLERNAIYTLRLEDTERTAKTLNKTHSHVLQEFEQFLKDEQSFELEPLHLAVHPEHPGFDALKHPMKNMLQNCIQTPEGGGHIKETRRL
jgi:hypothetical protein